MAAQKIGMTLGEFVEYASLPENADRRFEFIDGEIVEMAPGRTWNSGVGHLLAVAVHLFCREHDLPCYTSGGDGDYDVQGHVVCPDFAYKPTPLSKDYPDPEPPLWVVEVISPTDKAVEIRNKRQIYLQAGILLWEMYPQKQSIDVYAPGQPMHTVAVDGTLDVGDVLPGFTLAVKELFGE
ncbi:MAG: Uma2 family endonuclease [Anaerolineae bacterium]